MIIRIGPKPFPFSANSISNRQYLGGVSVPSCLIRLYLCLLAVASSSVDSNWFVLSPLDAKPPTLNYLSMAAPAPHAWGIPPWHIDFTPPPQPLPAEVDLAIVGAGFTGLAAAAWHCHLAPGKSVAVLEAGKIGAGASGRTGGIVLAETAAGDLPGLGDVLAGFQNILRTLEVDCDLSLPGSWEIGRTGGIPHSPIFWHDSGTLRVVGELPGGTLDPGKLVAGLARAAHRLGAVICENQRVKKIRFGAPNEIETSGGRLRARKILFAANALSLDLTRMAERAEPRLTLAVLSAPLRESDVEAIGLASRKPFYTADLPYLWGRLRADNSIIWGAGLVSPRDSTGVESVGIHDEEAAQLFESMRRRVRGLHPALASVEFTHHWGGPILFRDNWRPVLDWHPQSRDAIVTGAYAGHGVALSSYIAAWAVEAFLQNRPLPPWGKVSTER
jgi:gamma-glutamylputrescine oxidase